MRMGWTGAVAVGTLEEDRFSNGFRVLHGFWISFCMYCEVLHTLLWQDEQLHSSTPAYEDFIVVML
jgi:hypothetical protein